jgi:hypothetical protein
MEAIQAMQDAYRLINEGIERVRQGMDILAVMQVPAVVTVPEPVSVAADSALLAVIAERAFIFLNPSDRYLKILSAACKEKGEDAFGELCTRLKGRRRKWFGRSSESIAKYGKSTNPQQIPETPFWAMMNASSDAKRKILEKALSILGYRPEEIAKIIRTIY